MSNLNPRELVLVYTPGDADAALYGPDDRLIRAGHSDEVLEHLVDLLGITVEHADIVIDKDARGWQGVAQTLEELNL